MAQETLHVKKNASEELLWWWKLIPKRPSVILFTLTLMRISESDGLHEISR
jgi:hypothetical protein